MFVTTSYGDDDVVPAGIRDRYEWIETGSAAAILKALAPHEWADLLSVLDGFALAPNRWLVAGGNKGDIAADLDARFRRLGWLETRIDVAVQGYLFTDFAKKGTDRVARSRAEGESLYLEGYRVDNHKGRMIVDIEWNAKDGNLDRDMAAYRSWYEFGLIDGAVIITKDRKPLLDLAREVWTRHQATVPVAERSAKLPVDLTSTTTTSFDKATERIRRGGAGTCPLLVIGVGREAWDGSDFTLAPETDPAGDTPLAGFDDELATGDGSAG
ncbi:restriction endonuclease [Agromyces sp. CFH 90414]|uniref:Restriction endonuclease n=1 Tax=Agromyces agglutinans TaxID=2662258 RepID=A0A6I2FFU5_9MICO|nr:BglII/BstYI family type II restriction endonuclease [Agromyces agglutinans]MRG59858.1 restriction endonuclease [Agromyces agglutinans]